MKENDRGSFFCGMLQAENGIRPQKKKEKRSNRAKKRNNVFPNGRVAKYMITLLQYLITRQKSGSKQKMQQ